MSELIKTFCENGSINDDDAQVVARIVDVAQDTMFGLRINGQYTKPDMGHARDIFETIEKVLSGPTKLTFINVEILTDRYLALERRLLP